MGVHFVSVPVADFASALKASRLLIAEAFLNGMIANDNYCCTRRDLDPVVAPGLERDGIAVRATLTLPYSSGRAHSP
jgi:hypothetical protein